MRTNGSRSRITNAPRHRSWPEHGALSGPPLSAGFSADNLATWESSPMRLRIYAFVRGGGFEVVDILLMRLPPHPSIRELPSLFLDAPGILAGITFRSTAQSLGSSRDVHPDESELGTSSSCRDTRLLRRTLGRDINSVVPADRSPTSVFCLSRHTRPHPPRR